jgi:hypothetical protein
MATHLYNLEVSKSAIRTLINYAEHNCQTLVENEILDIIHSLTGIHQEDLLFNTYNLSFLRKLSKPSNENKNTDFSYCTKEYHRKTGI